MLQCWAEDPLERPNFSDLHKSFDQFLSNHTRERYPYIELQIYSYDHLEPCPSDDTSLTASVNHTADTVHSNGTGDALGQSTKPAVQQLQVPNGALHGSQPELRARTLREGDADRLSLGWEAGTERRYVESPVNLSRTSTFSIQDDLIAHLERRLSHLGLSSPNISGASGDARLAWSNGRPFTIHTDQPQEHVFQLSGSAPLPGMLAPRQAQRVHSVCVSELQGLQDGRMYSLRAGEGEGTEEERECLRVVFRETDV